MKRVDEAWKTDEQVRFFLEGVRAAIPFSEAQLDTMMRLLSGLNVENFLDLGCGDGILSARILGTYPGARGVLLDLSPPMLGKAKKSLSSHGNALAFIEADLAGGDWPGAVRERAGAPGFDAVVSGYAIHHLADESKRRVYAAVFKLLRDGGIFINMDHVAPPSPRVHAISNALFIESLRAYHEAEGGPGDFEKVKNIFLKRVSGEGKVLAPVCEQCRWLEEAGFEEVDCHFKSLELAVFGGRKPGG